MIQDTAMSTMELTNRNSCDLSNGVMPLFDVEYILETVKHRDSYNRILIGTYALNDVNSNDLQ